MCAQMLECLRRVVARYRRTDPEIRRLKWNWVTIYFTTSLVSISYFIAIPSLHQFVTSSQTPSDSSVEPGLGLSEIWYSWIVSMASIGGLIGAVTIGFMIRWFYIKHLILVNLFLCFSGGLLYAIGQYGWMILVGRLLIGLFQGSFSVLLRAYIGETSELAISMLPEDKQSKSTIKYTNFFITFIIGTSFFAIGPAFSAVASLINGLDHFRWPGVYQCIHSGVLFIIIVVVFREKRTDMNRLNKCGCGSTPLSKLGIIAFLILSFFVANSYFSILETQENPILSDNFGLDITLTSYIFAGSLATYGVVNILVYSLQRCHIDNRIIAIVGSVLSVLGALVLTDWQAIGGDPCNQFSNITLPCSRPDTLTLSLSSTIPPVLSTIPCLKAHRATTNLSISTSALSCEDKCTDTSCLLLQSISTLLPALQDSNATHVLCLAEDEMKWETLQCLWINTSLFLRLEVSTPINWVHEWSGNGEILEPLVNCSVSGVVALFTSESVLLNNSCDSTMNEVCEETNSQINCSYNQSELSCLAEEHNISLTSCDQTSSAVNQSKCVCQAFSSAADYKCFWNPESRITGEYCDRCPATCLSETYSLNFVQLIIGLLLFTPGFAIGRVILTMISSDIMGRAPQGLLMGALVAAGTLARVVGPLWSNPSYLAIGRRTWLPMMVLLIMQLVVLIGFIVLYPRMAPNKKLKEEEKDDVVELLRFEVTDSVNNDSGELVDADLENDFNSTLYSNEDHVNIESEDKLL